MLRRRGHVKKRRSLTRAQSCKVNLAWQSVLKSTCWRSVRLPLWWTKDLKETQGTNNYSALPKLTESSISPSIEFRVPNASSPILDITRNFVLREGALFPALISYPCKCLCGGSCIGVERHSKQSLALFFDPFVPAGIEPLQGRSAVVTLRTSGNRPYSLSLSSLSSFTSRKQHHRERSFAVVRSLELDVSFR
jgi:hypothetical protein